MAAAVTMPAAVEPFVPLTISGTGFAATTAYQVKVTDPSGFVRLAEVTSDGSGAFSVPHVPQQIGTSTVQVRPMTEVMGTTTAAATLTHKTKGA